MASGSFQILKNAQSAMLELLETQTKKTKTKPINYIVDASAWIDYFLDTEKGKKIGAIIEKEENNCFTPASVIAEVVSKMVRAKINLSLAFPAIINLSEIINLTGELATAAGHIHVSAKQSNKDFGMLDAFVVAAAKKLKAKILTADSDFKPFREAIVMDNI